jgi:hypothetical protein
MINLRSEKSIETVLIKTFEEKGWQNKKKQKIHGVDIKLWHPVKRRYWFIETKRAYTTKHKKSQTYVNVATAPAQIIYRMTQKKSGYYGIAVPNNKLFKKELSKIPIWIKKTLNIHLFLINNKEKIENIKPSKKVL